MNPGGIRADLTPNANGELTYAGAFAVEPFGSSLITMTLTGDQIHTILMEQFATSPPRVLAVSAGFTYTFTASAFGVSIDPTTMKLNGTVIDPAGTYRVVANSFLALGGDGFTPFGIGTDRIGGILDVDALTAFLGTHDPVPLPTSARITRH